MTTLRSLNRPCVRPLGAFLLAVMASSTWAVDVLTQHNDLNRNGANLSETVLTASNVNATAFGKLYERPVDGQIFAQPLYVSGVSIGGGTHNVVYVATQNNAVYAFDADDSSAAAFWSKSSADLGAYVPITDITGDTNFNPNVGITSTPVIDKATNTIYLVAMSRVGTGPYTYNHKLHALDIRTGAEKFGGPVAITDTNFNSFKQAQRPGLALANSNIYVAFGSFSDQMPYSGYVFSYDATTLAKGPVFLTCQDFQAIPAGPGNDPYGAGIWQSGCAPAVDAGGNLYVVTGNGYSTTTNVLAVPSGHYNYGESVIKLSPTLAVLDFFTPFNRDALNSGDADLGVCGQMLLPDQPFTAFPHLMIHGSKEGKIYLENRDALGKFNATTDQNVQTVTPYGSHTHATPIYWVAPSGPRIFTAPEDPGSINAYAVSTDPASTAPLTLTASSPATYRGTQMSLSANGSTAGSGVIWTCSPTVGDPIHVVGAGIFRAYNAETLAEIYNSTTNQLRDSIGNYPKYCAPTVANGKVYLATWSNKLCVFGPIVQNSSLAVLITNPANNGVFSENSPITINASAITATGSIVRVEFFSDGISLGADTSAPYSRSWTSVYAGTHTLQALVTDTAGAQALSPMVTVTITGGGGTGTILREYWDNIAGVLVSDLTSNANYPNTPTTRNQPTSFEAPTNIAEKYGTRMRGYVHPPVTGNYTFWIASDDNSQLLLSTDATAANATQIASVTDWTNSQEWGKFPSQQSAAIPLVAGQKYYIEALQKEGGGGDNLAVGWRLPDGTYERPIVGGHLSPFVLATTPTVTSLIPTVGPTTGGTSVAITGSGFTGASAVTFGGTAASTFTVNSNTSITASTAAHSAGAVNVDVTANGLVGTLVNGFTYQVPAGTPTIATINPVFGPPAGNTTVTITGTNLAGTSAVTFGGVAATGIVAAATSITCVTPAHGAGAVDVVVTTSGGNATASNAFAYVPLAGSPPAVASSSGKHCGLGGLFSFFLILVLAGLRRLRPQSH